MTFGTLMAVAAAAGLASACGGSTTTSSISEVTGPSAVRCQTSASAPSTFPYAGSRATVTVVAPRECEWTVTSEASWAQVSPRTGQGEAAVTVTVAENEDARSRSATLVVNDTRLTLTQEAAPCRYRLGSSTARLSHDGGRTAVSVSTSDACSWTASSSAAWARVVNPSGSGSGSVPIDVAENTGPPRTATLTIAGQSFTLSQDSRPDPTPGPNPPPPGPGPTPPPPPPPNPTPTCTASIDSAERSFGASGGSGSVRVTIPGGCPWNAVSDSNWVTLSGSNGSGSGTVGYSVGANSSTQPRSATISVAGRTHQVRQDGAAAPPPPPPPPPSNERLEFTGHVLLLDGSCPNLTFVVQFRRVFTNDDTKFKGGRCHEVRPGNTVRVRGFAQSDGRIRATEVRLRDDDDDDDDDDEN